MFEKIVERIKEVVEREVERGLIISTHYSRIPEWEKGREVVTRRELAYELGKRNSALLLMWGEAENKIYTPPASVPPLPASSVSNGSLAVVVICDAEVSDEYENFRAMRDAFYSLNLRGVTVRSLPSQMRVWLRVGKEADERGFNLQILGRATVEAMNSLNFVKATDVIFLTSKKQIEILGEEFSMAGKIIEALVKMHEEKLLNCDECDYKGVCSEIPQLKKIRENKVREIGKVEN